MTALRYRAPEPPAPKIKALCSRAPETPKITTLSYRASDIQDDIQNDIQDNIQDILVQVWSKQVRSRSGPSQLKFNSLELDTEVGRLVVCQFHVKALGNLLTLHYTA